jgi:transposase
MARPVLKVKGYEPDQVQALIKRDERYTIGIRLYAVHQVSLGQPARKLEELYHTSFKQITNWVHRFEQEGVEGLKDKPGRGRKAALDAGQLLRVKALLLNESPELHHYNTATWTGPMLTEWVKKEFGVTYKKAHIYNIIKSLGFSYQKGKGIFPETNLEKQEVFKESLKKTAGRST